MKLTKIRVPIYDFKIVVVEIESKEDKNRVIEIMIKFGCSSEHIEDESNGIEQECMNGGNTYRQLGSRKILVTIYPCKNEATRREILNHEKRHIEDRILEYCGVDDIEASAYLAGYLSRYMY